MPVWTLRTKRFSNNSWTFLMTKNNKSLLNQLKVPSQLSKIEAFQPNINTGTTVKQRKLIPSNNFQFPNKRMYSKLHPNLKSNLLRKNLHKLFYLLKLSKTPKSTWIMRINNKLYGKMVTIFKTE